MTLADEPGHRGSACTARDHARLGAPPVQIGYTPRHPTPPKRRPMSPNVPASQRAYLPSTPGAPCRCTAPSTPCTPIRPLIHPRRPRTDRQLQSPFVQEGFCRYVGLTPMQYLRQIRLEHAHHDL